MRRGVAAGLAAVLVLAAGAKAEARLIGAVDGRAVDMRVKGGKATFHAVAADGSRAPLLGGQAVSYGRAHTATAGRGAWSAGGRLAVLNDDGECDGAACVLSEHLSVGPVEAGPLSTVWTCSADAPLGNDPRDTPTVALGDATVAVAGTGDCRQGSDVEVIDLEDPSRAPAVIRAGGPVWLLAAAGDMVAHVVGERVTVVDRRSGGVVQELAPERSPAGLAVRPDGTVAVLLPAESADLCAGRVLVKRPTDATATAVGSGCLTSLAFAGDGRVLFVERTASSAGRLVAAAPGAPATALAWVTVGPPEVGPWPWPTVHAEGSTVALVRPTCTGGRLTVLDAAATAPATADVPAECPVRFGKVRLRRTAAGRLRASVLLSCSLGCRGEVLLPNGRVRKLRLAAGAGPVRVTSGTSCGRRWYVRFDLWAINARPVRASRRCP